MSRDDPALFLLRFFLSSIYIFFNSESPEYFHEIYFPAEPSKLNTRSSFSKVKATLKKIEQRFE